MAIGLNVPADVVAYIAANNLVDSVVTIDHDDGDFRSYYVSAAGDIDVVGRYDGIHAFTVTGDTFGTAPVNLENPTIAEVTTEVGLSTVVKDVTIVYYKPAAGRGNTASYYKVGSVLHPLSNVTISLDETWAVVTDPNYATAGDVSFAVLDKIYARISTDDAEPWKPGYDYIAGETFWFTNTVAGTPTSNGVMLEENVKYFGLYPADTTSGAAMDAAEILKVETVNVTNGGLRNIPVADIGALTALVPKEFELRLVKDTNTEYVFRLTPDLSVAQLADADNIADAAATGRWIKASAIAMTHITATALAAADVNAPTDAEFKAYIADTTKAVDVGTAYYTGTDLDTDEVTYAYSVDAKGVSVQIQKPSTNVKLVSINRNAL